MPSACEDRASKAADNEPSIEGVDSAEMWSRRRTAESVQNAESGPQMGTVIGSTWPCPVGSGSPPLRAPPDRAAVESIRHPQHVEQAVSLELPRR